MQNLRPYSKQNQAYQSFAKRQSYICKASQQGALALNLGSTLVNNFNIQYGYPNTLKFSFITRTNKTEIIQRHCNFHL